MHSKKEIRQRKKHMASFMTAKSTAKLKEEIDQVLAEEIPDPNIPLAFDLDAPSLPVDEGTVEEDIMDMMDAEKKAQEEDEDSQRY